MKTVQQMLAQQAKKQAQRALKHNANSTTSPISYQPKAPAELKKFSKHDNVQ